MNSTGPDNIFSQKCTATFLFAFNAKEHDDELYGTDNSYDYVMRMYDPRLARFISVDPITRKYADLSPYQFASNRPIDGIDINGKEWDPLLSFFVKVATAIHEFTSAETNQASYSTSHDNKPVPAILAYSQNGNAGLLLKTIKDAGASTEPARKNFKIGAYAKQSSDAGEAKIQVSSNLNGQTDVAVSASSHGASAEYSVNSENEQSGVYSYNGISVEDGQYQYTADFDIPVYATGDISYGINISVSPTKIQQGMSTSQYKKTVTQVKQSYETNTSGGTPAVMPSTVTTDGSQPVKAALATPTVTPVQ